MMRRAPGSLEIHDDFEPIEWLGNLDQDCPIGTPISNKGQTPEEVAMGYLIICPKGCCSLWAENVAELLNHRDEHCLFMCPCGHNGYVEKSFNLQDKHFGPVLRGAISLGRKDETYWPFVYFVSDKPDGKIDDLWFA